MTVRLTALLDRLGSMSRKQWLILAGLVVVGLLIDYAPDGQLDGDWQTLAEEALEAVEDVEEEEDGTGDSPATDPDAQREPIILFASCGGVAYTVEGTEEEAQIHVLYETQILDMPVTVTLEVDMGEISGRICKTLGLLGPFCYEVDADMIAEFLGHGDPADMPDKPFRHGG